MLPHDGAALDEAFRAGLNPKVPPITHCLSVSYMGGTIPADAHEGRPVPSRRCQANVPAIGQVTFQVGEVSERPFAQ
jgi:hypothetical protein